MKLSSLEALPTLAVSHNPEIHKQVMLDAQALPPLMNFSQARFAPGQVATAHAHADMAEVFFVYAGSGTICVDGENYPLTPGTCVAVEPGEVHEVRAGDQGLVLTYFGLRL